MEVNTRWVKKKTSRFSVQWTVDFQGSRVTSDGGLILVRELDERLGLGKLIDEHLSDSRQGLNKKFPLADLLRQSVYSRLAGYEDLNDAVRVSADPTFRLIGSKRNWDRGAALTSTLHRRCWRAKRTCWGLSEPGAGRAKYGSDRVARHGLHGEPRPRPTGSSVHFAPALLASAKLRLL